jgi:hypothetical protein
MNNQLIPLVTEVLKGVVGIAFIIITPYAIKAFKATEQKAKVVLGDTNYNYVKSYIENQYKLHQNLFTEANIIAFIDELDNKFGDRLSKDTIRRIVDTVIVGAKQVK